MIEYHGPQKKILVVDDEQSTIVYLETLLQDNDYETASAHNGAEGLEKIISEKPDLVLLDINMPEQSGIRLYRNLREKPEFASIPVIIVTAVTGWGGDPEEFHKFISTRKKVPPPEGFVPKPIVRESLLKTIADILLAKPK
ncbi:MAG: response regulator [bacterium]|nr:response regulator [bacterium]